MLEEKEDNLREQEIDQTTQPVTESNENTEAVVTENDTEITTSEIDSNHTALEEIDNENAEDAEDEDNKERHSIPLLDYHSMNMDALVDELEKLLEKEKYRP